MDWTLVRNLLQACPLLFAEVAQQSYRNARSGARTLPLSACIACNRLRESAPAGDALLLSAAARAFLFA